MFPFVALIGNLWNRSPFLSCTLLYKYAGRDEVGRLTSESASAFKKKDDAAYTCAKFVHFLCEGPRRKRMECERKNNHREEETV